MLFLRFLLLELMALGFHMRPQNDEGVDCEIFTCATTPEDSSNCEIFGNCEPETPQGGSECEIFGTCPPNNQPLTVSPKPEEIDCYNTIDDIDLRTPGSVVVNDCNKNRTCSFYAEAGYRCAHSWNCDKSNTIITDGKGLIDVRNAGQISLDASDSKCPVVDQICCKNPDVRALPPDTIAELPIEVVKEHIKQYGKCGRSSLGRVNVTGIDPDSAKPTEFPHMCVLFRKQGGKNVYIGGGSLIAKNKVLTVAHKFKVTQRGTAKDLTSQIGEFFVRCGEFDLKSTTEIWEKQDSAVQAIHIHPQYNPKKVTNNLAILITKQNFIYEEHIGPVCLPRPDEAFDNEKGKDCWSCGWGADKYQGPDVTYSDTLRKVQLGVVDRNQCENILQNTDRFTGKGFKLDDSWMCIGGELGKDTCKGDGGSPHVCKRSNDDWVQVGAVAWGLDCGKAIPAIYSSIPKAMCWIDWVMSCHGDATSNVAGVSVDAFDIRDSSNEPDSINSLSRGDCQAWSRDNPDLTDKCYVRYFSIDERIGGSG